MALGGAWYYEFDDENFRITIDMDRAILDNDWEKVVDCAQAQQVRQILRELFPFFVSIDEHRKPEISHKHTIVQKASIKSFHWDKT